MEANNYKFGGEMSIMTRQHVDHGDIAKFAQDSVNLPRDKSTEYRAQARRLREKLDKYLSENPNVTLKKILLSGSLAKGTALRSINDIDMACYISDADTPRDVTALLNYLIERLREAFPNFSQDQVSRWNCTQDLTDYTLKLGKLGGTK